MFRNRVIGFLIAALFATGSMAQPQQPAAPAWDFAGHYVVTDIVGYGDVSGGPPEAKRLLDRVLTISAKSIDFSGERCKPSAGFQIKEVETAPALQEYYGGVTPVDVGLGPKALLLDSENCTHVFRMDEYRVVFGWDGIVVRAIRDNRLPSQRGKPAKK
jgi:hypothetical protein